MKNQYPKTVLAIHAHPDDTEIFCAGTLALLKAKGFNIVIVTMTAGGMGGIHSTEADTIRLREIEARKAAESLGAKYICLGQRDGFLYDHEALRMETLRLIRREKAGIVMTHLPFDYHADHRATALIVEAATMLTPLPNMPVPEAPLETTPLLYHTAPLGFSDPIGQPIATPHFFIDITSTIEDKMQMLAEHHTQMELMRVMHKMDDFFAEMKKFNADLGRMIGKDYGECFWQHLGGGFQKDPLLQETLASFIHHTKECS